MSNLDTVPDMTPRVGRSSPGFGAPLTLVLPAADPSLGGLAALLRAERGEFEAALGVPVEFADRDPGTGPRWLLHLDPDHAGPPRLSWTPGTELMTSHATDLAGMLVTLNLLHPLVRQGGGTLTDTDCTTWAEAADRLTAEVAGSYPAFGLRGLSWPRICARHHEALDHAADPLAAAQRWIAELQDAHTWVSTDPRPISPPYVVSVDGPHATFVRVLPDTPAYDAGVRAGWRLTDVDPVDWLARTSAPAHALALIAGRRLMSVPPGSTRRFRAVDPAGRLAEWADRGQVPEADTLVTWRGVDHDTGYLRLETWRDDPRFADAVQAALDDLRTRRHLILDLRGNVGGVLTVATACRDRFLRGPTRLGSIRYSDGRGGLGPRNALDAEPAPAYQCWAGRLTVLTDPLTYSASEDFLLGLQGLEHVRVVGQRSGGGSGRPRTVRLVPGVTLTVSTALTYDRNGHCIEGAGVPVDIPLPAEPARPDAPDAGLLTAVGLT